jgi:hypothetical protein
MSLSHKLGISSFVVNEAIEELVEAGELVYTYRDPDSYVEILLATGATDLIAPPARWRSSSMTMEIAGCATMQSGHL